MSSGTILRICFVSACSNALLLHDSHALNIQKAIVVSTSRRAAFAHRHRRYHSTPSTPCRRRRATSLVYCPEFLRKTSRSFALNNKTTSRRSDSNGKQHHPRSREATRLDARPVARNDDDDDNRRNQHHHHPQMEHMIALHNSLEEVMMQPSTPAQATPIRPSRVGHCGGASSFGSGSSGMPDSSSLLDDISSPQPRASEDFGETRSTRSTSSASRNTNRLSLTLPIALPNAVPSRPTPISTTSSSFPPTPVDTPSLMSPTDPADFIQAIAAQERRVLEIREELSHAETELKRLKKQWHRHEAQRKRAESRNVAPLIPVADTVDDSWKRQSISELDKKKALLLGQQDSPGGQETPERSRRRVFRGGHTRALSLLSPKKLADGFEVHDDGSDASMSSKGSEPNSPFVTGGSRFAHITPAQLAKRASWAPRSAHQQATGMGMKQIAEDLKAGLWTFVEDLRQVAVGDEPITGHHHHHDARRGGADRSAASGLGASPLGADQDTIRASTSTARPRLQSAFDEVLTPTPATRNSSIATEGQKENTRSSARNAQPGGLQRSKTESSSKNATKRFSWTPLTVDALDDGDWSNWDSPTVGSKTTQSPRWSGSTVSGGVGGDITTIAEKQDENDTPLKKKGSRSQLPARAPSLAGAPGSLQELLPPVLNQLTPSNIKRATSDFMKEWERSLSVSGAEAATVPVEHCLL